MTQADSGPANRAREAALQMHKAGYALLPGALSAQLVADMNAELSRRYPGLATGTGLGAARETGKQRYMVTLELSGPFAQPEAYANPTILEVLRLVLEGDPVLENFGMVVSLPGAPAQHRHRDGGVLFDSPMAGLLPAHAVTIAIPLIDMNAERGTTEVLPGSHRAQVWDRNAATVAADVAAGSCLMWDYRTIHGGTANQSKLARPLLYATYGRAWWRDLANFQPEWTAQGPVMRQPPLLPGEGFLAKLPAEHRPLFRHFHRP
jgi:ectoine hydroxylase-related dioxygenase (phytanoyl-CoA dioxygenase family)